MSAYYNEFDPFAASWLRELIKAGLITDGEVDERSIVDVRADDLRGFAQCHFFAGIGVWSYALRKAGWPDDRRVWTGSAPCQPHSGAANSRKKGFEDERDLFPIWFNLIRERNPDAVLGEQVDDSVAWIDRTRTAFEKAGYAWGGVDLPACAADAPNERMRTFFVADANRARFCKQSREIAVGTQFMGVKRAGGSSFFGDHRTTGELGRVRRIKPGVRLLADGSAGRVGRLRGYGNAINAEVARLFIMAYMEAAA